MEKIISVLLVICILVSCTVICLAAPDDVKLRFNEDGKFKILALADVQDSYPLEPAMIQFINEALDYTKPDLVVFVGDNIVGEDIKAIDEMIAPLADRDVPFTFVFGNHDDQDGLTKDMQLSAYQKYDECLAYDAVPELHGTATHNLPILSSDGKKTAFNLWMFDSGTYYFEDGVELGYDWVRKDQIEWYNSVRDEMTKQNGGNLVPSIAFQHIIPQEPCKEIFYKSPFNLGNLSNNFADGTSYTYIPNLTKYDGIIFEQSCPSYGNDGQWDAMVKGGDVLGLVVGHDHVNNFIVNVDGVDLIQTPAVTYNSYYTELYQGARIIELDENDPWNYETYMVTANELALQEGSKLNEIGDRDNYEFIYKFEKIFSRIYVAVVENFKKLIGLDNGVI